MTASKKPKKKYSLYRQGVNDTIEIMSKAIMDAFASDPYADRQQIEAIIRLAQTSAHKIIE